MNQSSIPQRLKRVKAILPSTFRGKSGDSDGATDIPSQVTVKSYPGTCHRILRVYLGHPWDNYDYIRHIDHVMLARDTTSCFKLVNIRQCSASNELERQLQIISTIQHPNLAAIYDVYCDDEEAFLITENLDISISQLDFQTFEPKEWEIATVLAEVLTRLYYQRLSG
ncbi:hypothetical protein D0Z07_9216 [Hyphodiscus hymeniophilus]|uniref:Protein kinase domain-containing protein n=1 Tax=Hyphodiscus hymeniophilus TaxID=353542 RepID=A0A9P6VDJ3_9HELO|nr:hypothetical protein D0Z07_9216 [Hyphodiscus hymeniophilus]